MARQSRLPTIPPYYAIMTVMRCLKTVLLWLVDACKTKVEKDAVGDIDKRLSQIEQNLGRIEKSPLPIGLFCSGLPIMMIGLTSMIDGILQSGNYKSTDFIYYFIGMFMVSLGLKLYYKRNTDAFIVISVSSIMLIIVVLIKTFTT